MAAPGGGLEAEEAAAGPALGRLEEEARRRRERLRALRQRTLQNKDGGERESKQFREDEEEETVKHKGPWGTRGCFNCGPPLFALVTGKCEHKINRGRVSLLAGPADSALGFPAGKTTMKSPLETTGRRGLKLGSKMRDVTFSHGFTGKEPPLWELLVRDAASRGARVLCWEKSSEILSVSWE
ncbi:coiled-coil domain-containing protein 12 isoform X1 [Rissa tridactyla]|uniref:coiled-coil domain-containing protein 12 isoform X1 n=1 Tax=Rissa tridactyla TaxID=75485 RepID=UPI0023BA6E93|nr:coiled-coil domain-containing protein 12 isoform X1 [Rissa tridactyla]